MFPRPVVLEEDGGNQALTETVALEAMLLAGQVVPQVVIYQVILM
jgi:hypothetical protein